MCGKDDACKPSGEHSHTIGVATDGGYLAASAGTRIDHRLKRNSIAHPARVQKLRFGGAQHHIGIVDCQHGCIVGGAEDKAPVHETSVIRSH